MLPVPTVNPPPPPAAYEIVARLDAASHEIAGQATVVFVNPTQRPLDEIAFQLYPNNFRPESRFLRKFATQASVDALFPAGRDPGWLAVEAAEVDGAVAPFRTDETAGFLGLAAPLAPGATASVRLRFRTRVPQAFDRFGRVGDAYSLAYWYPRLAVPTPGGWDVPWRQAFFQEFHDLRSSFRVRLDLPASFAVGATGRRVGEEGLPGGRRVLRYEAENVCSFAFVADPGLEEAEARHGDVRIHVLTRSDERSLAQPLLKQTADLLDYYGQLVGPYPYGDLTVVSSVTVPSGGIELPQLVLLGRMAMTPETWLGWLGEWGLYGINAHEVAHQWFFGLLHSDEAQVPWLDEGFTSYLTRRYLEAPLSGRQGAAARFVGFFSPLNHLHLMQTDRESAYSQALAQELEGLAVPLTEPVHDLPFDQFSTFYKRGPAVIEMLRLELGDEAFDRFLKGLYAEHLYREASVDSIQAAAEEAAGRPLAPFFDTWVRGAGRRLDYRLVTWREESVAGGGRRVVASVEQLGDTDLAVPVAAILEDGTRSRGRYVPGGGPVSVDIPAQATARVRQVVVDPDFSTLDLDFTNNGTFPLAVFPFIGGPYPDRHALSFGVRPTGIGPGGALTSTLATIRGLHVDGGAGWTVSGPEFTLTARQPIYGVGNYQSSLEATVRQDPEGLTVRGDSRLAWQPRVGENPTLGLRAGLGRRLLQTDPATLSLPAQTQVTAAALDLDLDLRRTMVGGGAIFSGLRPVGNKLSVGLEAGLPLPGTEAWYYFPRAEVAGTTRLAWLTTLSARAVAGTTFGSRAPTDVVRLERQGGFRTTGLGSGNHLAAANFDLTFPLSPALVNPPVPFPAQFAGVLFANAGWAADRLPGGPGGAARPVVGEAGIGVRFGFFGAGGLMGGLDWIPYNTFGGADWNTFYGSGGFTF